jgi:hypothetical protein
MCAWSATRSQELTSQYGMAREALTRLSEEHVTVVQVRGCHLCDAMHVPASSVGRPGRLFLLMRCLFGDVCLWLRVCPVCAVAGALAQAGSG